MKRFFALFLTLVLVFSSLGTCFAEQKSGIQRRTFRTFVSEKWSDFKQVCHEKWDEFSLWAKDKWEKAYEWTKETAGNAAAWIKKTLNTALLTKASADSAVPSGLKEEEFSNLTETQRNSINMLNWLAYLTQEINSSSNNRLYIEEIYSLILNQTYPNAVDDETQYHLKEIRSALEDYRMIDIKRSRIQYLYEQNKAQAIRSAIPNPLTIMNIVQSSVNSGEDTSAIVARVALSVAYMAINSISSYVSSSSQAELQYLQDGWNLDDAASTTFYALRSETFDYMINIVRDYDLPGYLALNEEAVQEFVAWKNNENIVSRIQFLETHADTYRAFGSYWLVLAESYFKNGDYQKCLSAIDTYESLRTKIFRKDYEYAKLLPLAIASAAQVLKGNKYASYAVEKNEAILENIGTDEWALRYFAAQTYIDLYGRTHKTEYLQKAYDALLNNVNSLVGTQLTLNETYLAQVQEKSIPSGTPKEESTQIKNYNKLLKEKREKELPPVYEPLLINLDLLFAVAKQLDLPETEQNKIEQILHANGDRLFLVESLDKQYHFSTSSENPVEYSELIAYSGKELSVPASLVSENAVITVTISDEKSELAVFTDWTIDRVKRQTEGDLSTFTAVYKSKDAESFTFEEGMKVRVSVLPHSSYETSLIEFQFVASNAKQNWYDHVAFWNSDFIFQRVN